MRCLIFSFILVFTVLTQAYSMDKSTKPVRDLFPTGNTTYNINRAYDLEGQKLVVPENCTLLVTEGGNIFNGEIEGNGTILKCDTGRIGVKLSGTWNVSTISDDWFDADELSDREILDNINILQSDEQSQIITLNKKEYRFPIEVENGFGLNLKSNTILNLNTTLKLVSRNLKSYSIILIKDKHDVSISSGKIIGDVIEHSDLYVGNSEWGTGLNIINSANVTVNKMHITLCWGDGIYLGGGKENVIGEYDNACKSITLMNVVCDNNRRQGLSVTHVDGLLAKNCSFINTGRTKATKPASGVDIEPNINRNKNQSCRNIKFQSCVLKGNKEKAFTMYGNLTVKGVNNIENIILNECDIDGWVIFASPDIRFEKCRINAAVSARSYGSPVKAIFSDCILNSKFTSVTIKPKLSNTPAVFNISFVRCSIYVNDLKYMLPIISAENGLNIKFNKSKVSLSKQATKQLNKKGHTFFSNIRMTDTNVIYE